jgi:DNA polymerase-3 subunit epsilon
VAVAELLAVAASLGDPPSIIGKAEVDQINIISRWIHRHSDDRAFFPLQPALNDIDEARRLAQRIWVEIDAVRATPIEVGADEEEDIV